jgi:hypothetical protein
MAFDELERQQAAARKRKAIITIVVVVLIAVGLVASNEYIRMHRTIHVVNATGAAVKVSVDGGPEQTINDGVSKLDVPEGSHKIKLSGAVDETVDVNLEAGYLDRWLKKPAWIVNPGGEALFEERTVVFAPRTAIGNVNNQGGSRPIVGETMIVLPNVDYIFEEPPQSISVKGNRTVTKIALARVVLPEDQTFNVLAKFAPAKAIAYAERRLKRGAKGKWLDEYRAAKEGAEAEAKAKSEK